MPGSSAAPGISTPAGSGTPGASPSASATGAGIGTAVSSPQLHVQFQSQSPAGGAGICGGAAPGSHPSVVTHVQFHVHVVGAGAWAPPTTTSGAAVAPLPFPPCSTGPSWPIP